MKKFIKIKLWSFHFVSSKAVPSFFVSVRFIVTIMAFFGYCLQYMLKINLGIAIVCMVNQTALRHEIAENNATLDFSGGLNETIRPIKSVSCLFQEASHAGDKKMVNFTNECRRWSKIKLWDLCQFGCDLYYQNVFFSMKKIDRSKDKKRKNLFCDVLYLKS